MIDEEATTPGSCDGLGFLADALACYFAEVETWRAACERHQPTVAVRAADRVRLTRRFPRERSLPKSLAERLNRLGKASPPRPSVKDDICPPGLTGEWVEWEGRPLLVIVGADAGGGSVEVEVAFLPQHCGDLPENPMRAVASALACHEYLVPGNVASPLRVADWADGSHLTIAQHLQRAGSQTSLTVQCIYPVVKGHSPGRPGRG